MSAFLGLSSGGGNERIVTLTFDDVLENELTFLRLFVLDGGHGHGLALEGIALRQQFRVHLDAFQGVLALTVLG